MLQACVKRVGFDNTCALLSLPCWRVKSHLGAISRMWPVEKKAIWLVHCLIFNPRRLRSLFDVATFGRYLPDSPDLPKAKRPTAGGVRAESAKKPKPQGA